MMELDDCYFVMAERVRTLNIFGRLGSHFCTVDEQGRSFMEIEGVRVYAPSVSGKKGAERSLSGNLEPWVAPVLEPFVEGLWGPIDQELTGLKWTALLYIGGACGVSLAAGYVLGAVAPPSVLRGGKGL